LKALVSVLTSVHGDEQILRDAACIFTNKITLWMEKQKDIQADHHEQIHSAHPVTSICMKFLEQEEDFTNYTWKFHEDMEQEIKVALETTVMGKPDERISLFNSLEHKETNQDLLKLKS
jgi:hypothetical protein